MDEAPLKPREALLAWYEKIPGRTVDLIGDYAGNELFLVEGDSLLLNCLDTDDIDFTTGFQLLHAVHSVEAFLAALLQRKANYHIAFFDVHARYCMPARAEESIRFKYDLFRAVMIRHLSTNLRQTHPGVKVMHFKSYQDPDFTARMTENGLYFAMCHDGAASTLKLPSLPNDVPGAAANDAVETAAPIDRKLEKERRHAFRKMIYWFIKRGINIALTNSVEWQDTKVMAMVQERGRHVNPQLIRVDELFEADDDWEEVEKPSEHDAPDTQSILEASKSETHHLVATSLRSLLQTHPDWTKEASAFVLHTVMLKHLPLSKRRCPANGDAQSADFLKAVTAEMTSRLRTAGWKEKMIAANAACDVADLIDGRLFTWTLANLDKLDLTSFGVEFATEIEALRMASSMDGSSPASKPTEQQAVTDVNGHVDDGAERTLMPFSNDVFDKHLTSISVNIDKSSNTNRPTGDTARTFKELTHWHNTKPLQTGPRVQLTDWQKGRALRANQFFRRELQQYAASLTDSGGKSLDPERIFVGQTSQPIAQTSASADVKKAENAARLAEKNDKKFLAAWQAQLKDLEKVDDLKTRYLRARSYLNGLPSDRKTFLGYEVELYMLNLLLKIWIIAGRENKKASQDSVRYAALIFDTLNRLHKVDSSKLTKAMQKALRLSNDSLGLQFDVRETAMLDRPLSFDFALQTVEKNLKLPSSSLDFELAHCGPYLDRSIDAAPDSRVKFQPDAWQREVLDLIDEKKSVFVVAPTSAGKTFISFYAMKQVLSDSDDGILVYVAPTKALVNQIAAELQAQFSKNYKYPGKSVWAIHTRDYRINDPQGCQVLVTVPHILQIMLLAPSNAKMGGWSQRVRRIIYDEVHCIGQAEDGVVWEQLLLLSPCPIIALSATVGNSEEFTDWLKTTQASMGFDLQMVKHETRYSDLRKFVYNPPKTFTFQPLETDDTLGLPSLDGAPGLAYLHPVAALVNESRGMPDDLHLEPRDCLTLWQCMKKHSKADYPVDDSFDPSERLPAIVRKVDVLAWEAKLKDLLRQWMKDPNSPFKTVVNELSEPMRQQPQVAAVQQNGAAAGGDAAVDRDDLLSTTMPLLATLNARNALPAILFNYDRSACEKIGQILLEKLAEYEEDWKKTSPVWKKKLKAFEDWKKSQERRHKKAAPKKSKSKGDEDDGGAGKAEREREAAEIESNPFAAFDPNAPVAGFHFADEKAMLPSEFDEVKKRLEYRHIAPWLIDALKRGIGIHHAGMNRAYRQAVETMFRKRFLRVVVATGTLALGINMPCKTVVFSGDSVFLTALNYRQGAGRAGRRGFDLLGNVVFQNIREDKVCRLVSSRLPDLNGHFPVTTTLILRLFTLLSESKQSAFAKKSIDSLLSQPRLYLGGEAFREQVLHHLRYSIEYLRRQHLISETGKPVNFAGTVSHLYFTENSAFAFHALLKDGYFNRLCADFVPNGKTEPRILDTLMLTLAHLFGRHHCRRADQEFVETVVKKYGSCVFLPKMPNHAHDLLAAHNAETLEVFTTYVKTFVEQHGPRMGADRKLPLTQMLVGGDENADALPAINSLPPTKIRSAFVALSGHGDNFQSIAELCRTVRDGVFLESSAIPHVALYPHESEMPLNAYLYDFFKHGDVATLVKANGVKRGDIWFLLNDFSMVLATIVTSFKNFMNVEEDADLEFTEVAGSGDLHEIDEDDRIANEQEGGASRNALPTRTSRVAETQTAQLPTANNQQTVNKKKNKKLDSWGDDADAASSSSEDEDWDAGMSDDDGASTSTKPTTVGSGAPAWEEESGEGLRKVAQAFERLKKTFDEKFKKMWA